MRRRPDALQAQRRLDSAEPVLKTPEAPHAPQGVPAGRSEVVEGGDG